MMMMNLGAINLTTSLHSSPHIVMLYSVFSRSHNITPT